MEKYDSLKKIVVYDFKQTSGGIGDNIKYFVYLLTICIKNNFKLYYKINNTFIEKHLLLKYEKMYIDNNSITIQHEITCINDLQNINENIYNIVKPSIFYTGQPFHNTVEVSNSDVFYFSDIVKTHSKVLLSPNISNYISIHLRLGDKYIETDKSFECPNDISVVNFVANDIRDFNEKKLFSFIKKNSNNNILFFCDNNSYKLKLKALFNNIIITNCEIAHTALTNTTDKQTIDALTEMYLLSNSEKIYAASRSGFSYVASNFNNIPWIPMMPNISDRAI